HLHLHSHAQGTLHEHAHPQGDARRSLGFGLLHGLAGSAAILVLLVAAAPTRAAQLAYFLSFAAGTMNGMLAVSVSLASVVRLASPRAPGSRVTSTGWSGTRCRARATPVPPTRAGATVGGARRTRSIWRRAWCTIVDSPSTRCCTTCCNGGATHRCFRRAAYRSSRAIQLS